MNDVTVTGVKICYPDFDVALMYNLGNECFLRVVAMATKRARKCLASAENVKV